MDLKTVTLRHIRLGWQLSARYGYSHFDSLILACALDTGCKRLYTEDMQHEQIIDGRLQIINPFFEAASS